MLRADIISLSRHGNGELMAVSDEELDQRIEEQEYMGIKGSILIEHYPYLLDYLPGRRIKKMYDLAVHEHKAYFLSKSLGFDPTEYSLAFRENG